MSTDWPSVRFANAPVEIIDGDRGVNYPKQADFRDAGYCLFLNAGNVTSDGFRFEDCAFITEAKDSQLRKGKLNRHDLVLTTRGTVGNVAYFGEAVPYENIRINSGMVILRASMSELLPRFLYLFLRSQGFREQVFSLTSGSAQPQLPIRDMNRIELLLPPIEEQHAIASILGALDDKIELNRRMNGTLEALAQAVFKEWFGNVREKTEDWKTVTLEELADIKGGKQLPTAECLPVGSFPVYGANGVMGYAERSTHEDFVIAFGRVGAYCGSIFWAYEGAWINNNASSVVPKRWPEYVLQAMLNVDFVAKRTGSAQPFIPNNVLAATDILLPSGDALDRYCEFVRPLRLKQVANDHESRTLTTLRDTLLPKLMRGEVRVKNNPKH